MVIVPLLSWSASFLVYPALTSTCKKKQNTSNSSPSRHTQSLSVSRIFLGSSTVSFSISLSIPDVYYIDVLDISYSLVRIGVDISYTFYIPCINKMDILNASYNLYTYEADISDASYNLCTIIMDILYIFYLNLFEMDILDTFTSHNHHTEDKMSFSQHSIWYPLFVTIKDGYTSLEDGSLIFYEECLSHNRRDKHPPFWPLSHMLNTIHN